MIAASGALLALGIFSLHPYDAAAIEANVEESAANSAEKTRPQATAAEPIDEKEYRQGLEKEGLIPKSRGGETRKSKAGATESSKSTADQSAPPNMHRVKMRLFGSLCASCLKTLSRKIKAIEGVTEAKVDGPEKTARLERFPGASARFAALTVDYDESRLSLSTILEKIRFSDFNPSKVEDSAVGSVSSKGRPKGSF